ncbi:CPBP family intramembrane glutamic endopeptidase [Phytomonospora sp. NPDC050363]|uniref:CPBP family intramembrane glutamic endopeptidase n=1 Tax=Phytomonospora sp. NPDC050363 TaxID=3155642 RepID=UPI003402E7A6
MSTQLTTADRRRGLLWFLLISFGVTWAYLFGARLLLGWSLVNPLVQLPMGFTPAIAAFAVRRWITREGFADAGLALRLRKAWWHYLVAWLAPLGLAVASCVVAWASGLWEPDLSGLDELAPGIPWWGVIVALQLLILVLTPVYFGEEFGWTGYLRLRIYPGRPVAATVATGLIWAVWHFPLAFLGYAEYSNVALGLAVWTISFLMQEIMLSWLRIRSGTIWTAGLAHAGNNMVLSLLTAALLTAGEGGTLDAIVVTVLMYVPMGALCVWIVLSGQLSARRTAARTPVDSTA